MKIEEAIKSLEQHNRWLKYLKAEEQVEAHNLGIEALKRIVRERDYSDLAKLELLLGETILLGETK